jgi:hypothetical protein
MNKEVINVVGQTIANWTITSQEKSKSGRPIYVDLRCACGAIAVHRRYRNLVSGLSKSCGKGNCCYLTKHKR